MAKSSNPIIQRNINIGAADAESDSDFLSHSFVDTGVLARLLDCKDPKCIVLGRTGSGKTALLRHIGSEKRGNVRELSPEAMALEHISNSNVIRFFESAGVNLDPFYKLLWQHAIAVELLRLKYGQSAASFTGEMWERIGLGRDKAKMAALTYLEEYGGKFWETTEYRTRHVANKIEEQLRGAAAAKGGFVSLTAEGAKKLSHEEREDIVQRGRDVVSGVQIHALHHIIELLATDVFTDSSDPYYILIDDLDQNWVEDEVRIHLIRALIEAIKNFKKVLNVKIIVSLRVDLLFQIIRGYSRPGLQTEKFESLILNLQWERADLIKVLDERVKYLYRRRYTKDNVTVSDILPKGTIDDGASTRSSIDYLLDRTFYRPREAILFFNECLSKATGQNYISVNAIRGAEVTYSQRRLLSLGEEWRQMYPELDRCWSVVSNLPSPFRMIDIDPTAVENLAVGLADGQASQLQRLAESYFLASSINYQGFLLELLKIFYRTGLVGVKSNSNMQARWSWSYEEGLFGTDGNIDQAQFATTKFYIHKTFWLSLGVRYKRQQDTN